MIKKRLITTLLAGVLVATMAFPSMADESTPNIVQEKWHSYSDGGGFTERYAYAPTYSFPSWHWINGYCYYFTDYIGGNRLTNCVTPDGYTVDELGRWTVDGVPQSNGYTGFVMGTDTLYAGLDDNQRWTVMQQEAEKVFQEYVQIPISMTTWNRIHGEWKLFSSTDDGITGNFTNNQYGNASITIAHDDTTLQPETHILFLKGFWNDTESTSIGGYSEAFEKIIKLFVGDHVGQELFNDFKAAGDPNSCTEQWVLPIFDENGNCEFDQYGNLANYVNVQGSDGIDLKLFDLNKWNGRKTDYGKTIKIEYPYDPNYMWSEYRISIMD